MTPLFDITGMINAAVGLRLWYSVPWVGGRKPLRGAVPHLVKTLRFRVLSPAVLRAPTVDSGAFTAGQPNAYCSR